MTFLWPGFLSLLVVLPVATGLYLFMLRRRRRYAVRFSSLLLVRDVLPRRSWLKRHLPFGLFLLAMAGLIVALARPANTVRVPVDRATIILALDVSRSMRQQDVWPSRFEAAKNAALSFIQNQDPGVQIGIVAFSGYAQVVQSPTTDPDSLSAAIQSLTLGRGTGIGRGLLEAVDLLVEIEGLVPVAGGESQLGPGVLLPGTYSPYIIILLTDGVNTTGPLPLEAAQEAALMGVRTYTIGFGTPIEVTGESEQPQRSDGNNQFRGFFRRGLDEGTLREVAAMTGGEYYTAESAGELESVFTSLPTNLITRVETTEITVFFAALGALLAALALALSLAWNPLM